MLTVFTSSLTFFFFFSNGLYSNRKSRNSMCALPAGIVEISQNYVARIGVFHVKYVLIKISEFSFFCPSFALTLTRVCP